MSTPRVASFLISHEAKLRGRKEPRQILMIRKSRVDLRPLERRQRNVREFRMIGQRVLLLDILNQGGLGGWNAAKAR